MGAASTLIHEAAHAQGIDDEEKAFEFQTEAAIAFSELRKTIPANFIGGEGILEFANKAAIKKYVRNCNRINAASWA